MLELVVRGGTIVTAEGSFPGEIGIQESLIAAVGSPGMLPPGSRELDATGLLVLPGLVDPHVHLGHRVFIEGRWVHASDDFWSGTRFAAAGGNTTVIDFAIQREGDLAATFRARRAEADGKSVVDYSLHVALTKASAETIDSIPDLIASGVTSFKLYMIYRKQGRMADDAVLLGTLLEASKGGAIVGVHAENSPIAEFNIDRAVQLGHTTASDFARAKPNHVEAEAVNRALFLAEFAGASLYVFHLSTREALEQVERARGRGIRVYAETCTHYLTLTEGVYDRPDGHRYICSPPLRSAADVEALWRGIGEGVVSVVSSDHCGFDTTAKDEGRHDFTRVPNGLPGVGVRLPVLYTYGVRAGRIGLPQLVSLLSTNPARIFGLYPRKGAIVPGSDADLVLVDPSRARVVKAPELDSPVDWSPYEDMELWGWPVVTVVRGQVVARDGRCPVSAGQGQFLERYPLDLGSRTR
ncbi:MAG TPA: dihydropyrimidinase [Thermoleophilia bacterium]|nr:dihydropyrimidinase [Thermoleophilia bacterium]